jgi:hypothetical protein
MIEFIISILIDSIFVFNEFQINLNYFVISDYNAIVSKQLERWFDFSSSSLFKDPYMKQRSKIK